MNQKTTPGARFARSWVSTYTGGLGSEASHRRVLEIESDLYEHEVLGGSSNEILSRSIRGIPADVWWRVRTLRESAGQARGSSMMSKNPMRKWWMVLVVVHMVATAVDATTTYGVIGQGNVAPIVVPVTIAGFVGLVVMATGLFMQRSRFVAGSWVVVIGLLPTLFSVTGVAVLLTGLWTANLAFREGTVALGYEGVSTRNREMMGRWLWAWFVSAALLFGLGWVGLYLDNWLLWILPWGIAGMLALAGIGMSIAVYTDRHRTRPA